MRFSDNIEACWAERNPRVKYRPRKNWTLLDIDEPQLS